MNVHESYDLYLRFLNDRTALAEARARFLRASESFSARPAAVDLPAFRVVQESLIVAYKGVFDTETLIRQELTSRGIEGPVFHGHLGVAVKGDVARRTPWSFVCADPQASGSKMSYAINHGDFLRVMSEGDRGVLFEGVVTQHADGNVALGDVPFDVWSTWFGNAHPAQYVPFRRELRVVT